MIDVFSRRIVGWNVASTLKADVLPLQALNMAAFTAGGPRDELVHHADHGSRTTCPSSTPIGGTMTIFAFVKWPALFR